MPDFSDAYDDILGRFREQMATLRPLVPIAWPNVPFDPLTDFTPGTHQAWVRVTVLGGEARIASSGGTGKRRWRYVGVVTAQVFAPRDAGASTALAVADDVAKALRGHATTRLTSTFGTWADPLVLGGPTGLYIWYVAGKEYRKEGSAPTSATDGTEWIGGGTV